MKKFQEIFGTVMVEVAPQDIAMLGASAPIITQNGWIWAEFTE